jgi:hypothetical protein
MERSGEANPETVVRGNPEGGGRVNGSETGGDRLPEQRAEGGLGYCLFSREVMRRKICEGIVGMERHPFSQDPQPVFAYDSITCYSKGRC